MRSLTLTDGDVDSVENILLRARRIAKRNFVELDGRSACADIFALAELNGRLPVHELEDASTSAHTWRREHGKS